MTYREDLAQEAWVAMWRELQKGNTAWPYLAAVADNRIKSCLRWGTSLGSERGTRATRVPEGEISLTDDEAYLDQGWVDTYPSDSSWMGRLPERDQQFVDGFLSGESASSTARRLGLSEGYGRTEWKRIRTRLASQWNASLKEAA